MLGKLIKYDMKALNRFLIVIHLFLLLSAVLGRVLLTGRISAEALDTEQGILLLSLTILLYFIVISGVCFGTYIVIAIRFYKNLFSDEGYLSNTLPVTKGQHLLSKVISGSIWGFIDCALVGLALFIAIATPEVRALYETNKAAIFNEFGFGGSITPTDMILSTACLYAFDAICNVLMAYAAVVIGQLFSGHRVLGAVVSYFILTTLFSVLTLFVLMIVGALTDFPIFLATSFPSPTEFSPAEVYFFILKISVSITIVMTVIEYIVTYYLMRKKISLQ